MDWSKAKTILLGLFLLFNIFLLYINLGEFYRKEVSSETIENTKKILLSRDISFSDDLVIPKYNRDTGTLAYEGEVQEIDKLSFNVAIDKFPPTEKNLNKILIGVMEQSGIVSSKFVLDKNGYAYDEKTQKLHLIFIEKWQNTYIFGNRIDVYLTKDGSGVADISYRKIKKSNKKNEILSVYQILISNSFEKGTKIVDIAFGFAQEGEEDIYASPVWRIKDEAGKELYYSAYDGTQIKLRSLLFNYKSALNKYVTTQKALSILLCCIFIRYFALF